MANNDFIIKRNDTLPALSITVIEKSVLGASEPYQLTGVTAVTFTMVDDSGNAKIVNSSATIVSDTGGTIQYNWSSGDTDQEGKYNGEFELFFSSGKKMSLPTIGAIKIEILKDYSLF